MLKNDKETLREHYSAACAWGYNADWKRLSGYFRSCVLSPVGTRHKARNSVQKLLESSCWRALIRPKLDRVMQAVPFGRLPPGKSGTPPWKSGQLKKDLGLEVNSAQACCAANNF